MSIRQRLKQLENQLDAQLSEEETEPVTEEEIEAVRKMIEGVNDTPDSTSPGGPQK